MSWKFAAEATRLRRSLAARLTAWYALSSFAIMATFAAVPYWVLARNLRQQDRELLRERVGLVQNVLRDHPDSLRVLRQEVEVEWRSDSGRQFLARVLDGRDGVLAETPGMGRRLPVGMAIAHPDQPSALESFAESIGADGRPFRSLSRRIVLPARWARSPRSGMERAADGALPGVEDGSDPEVVHALGPSPGPGSAASPRPASAPALPRSLWLAGGEARVVQVALDLSGEQSFLGGYLRLLWSLLLASALASTLVGYLFARRAMRPLRDITEAVLGTQASTLRSRLAVARLPTELQVLATAYNQMLERLHESFERLSRFSADIAHELRTPLNNLLGQGEVALGRARSADEYRETLSSCLGEARRVSRICDSLLFLARAESPGGELHAEVVDLAREIEAVREFYAPAAEEAQVALGADVEGKPSARVDRTLFQRALGNLVENALRATAPGGSIALRARGTDAGRTARIEVVDSGIGIAPEHLPRIFDRFYRPDPARSAAAGGSGLGLAIVRSIATLHGGTATIDSRPGRGTRVILDLPAGSGESAAVPARRASTV